MPNERKKMEKKKKKNALSQVVLLRFCEEKLHIWAAKPLSAHSDVTTVIFSKRSLQEEKTERVTLNTDAQFDL